MKTKVNQRVPGEKKNKKNPKKQQQSNCSLEGALILFNSICKDDAVGDNPFSAVWGQQALRKKSTEQRANVRPPRISGLWGALLRQSRFLQDYDMLARISVCCSPLIDIHLSVRHTRSYDLDQRSFENRDTKWKA